MSNTRFDPRSNDRQLTGAILVGVGILALLGLTGLFKFIGGLVGAALFGVLAYYAYTQGERRGNVIWRLAAYPLAGLALAAILPGSIGGATFLASIGLAFAVYWRHDQTRWWAMIPAGVFASLAAVAFLEGFMGASAGWVFLLGLAATFFALTRLKVEPQPWAIWPAGVLGAITLLTFTSSGGWIVPVVLIAVGGWLLVRSGAIDLGGTRAPAPPAPPASTEPPAPSQPTASPAPTEPTASPAPTEPTTPTASTEPSTPPVPPALEHPERESDTHATDEHDPRY